MSYEEFKLYMTQNLNDISEEDLIKLWAVYEGFYTHYGEQANSILDLLIFIYKEIGQIDETDITFLTSVMLYIKNEIYLGCVNKDYLEKLTKEHKLFNELSEENKTICLKYIEENTKNKISDKIHYTYILEYYKNHIKKSLSEKQLTDILNLDITLRKIYAYSEIDFDDIRNSIIECYINNNFNYDQSYKWCVGRLATTYIKEFLELSYFFENLIKDEDILKESLDKYFILGCLNDLNYDLEDNINNGEVMCGRDYLRVKDDILLGIAESIENYWFDDMQKDKNGVFIFGIIKEGLDKKNLEENNQEILMNIQNSNFNKFNNFSDYLKQNSNLNFNDINYLWHISQKIGDFDNLDFNLIEIMLQIYSHMKDCNENKFIKAIFDLNEINNKVLTLSPTSFDDEILKETEKQLFELIKQYNMDYDTRKCCYKFINQNINKKRNSYYDEENIKEFFDNELPKICIEEYTEYEIEESIKECLKIYEFLINFPYLKNKPKYVIKNAILLSHVEYPIDSLNYNERLNLCIGFAFYKETNTLEDMNNIIYDYYNNKAISNKYKDIYFNYGILCYLDLVETNVNNKNNELKDGIKYYYRERNNDALVDIATNVDDYWHDLNVKKHDKRFQLGIIYKGLEYYQESLLYDGFVIDEKQLILRNNNFS